MAGLFGKAPPPPPPPKKVRMPNETDPAIQAAAERQKAAAMQRSGRMSTILTDATRATSGSGQKLGA